ncbi:hypothetical protein [Allosalinactinospora lopnorensis]|uniref:hypothetical protein n=1 Tax=Allosalinactinospora lopnorensis TaxID=1352348 RepID=UPI000A47423A|nr:hypothetical protein [Allosalinactinospora lopnorensis]
MTGMSGGVEPPVSAEGGDRPPLPKRRRQANLAPQLRSDGAHEAPEGGAQEPARAPEDVRRMFSAFQSGTRRGREREAGQESGTSERPGEDGSRESGEKAAEAPRCPGENGAEWQVGTFIDDGNNAGKRDWNGSGPLPGRPAYTAGVREGHADRPAGDYTGESE